jgi:hypothetical protein
MTQDNRSRRWQQAAATFIVIVLLAPPIADLVFAGLVGVFPAFAAADGRVHVPTETGFWVGAFLAMFALPFSYLFGGVQAAIGGAALAAYGWYRGRPPLLLAIGLALAAYGAGDLIGLYDRAQAWKLAFVFINLMPAIVCWFAIRPIWREDAA